MRVKNGITPINVRNRRARTDSNEVIMVDDQRDLEILEETLVLGAAITLNDLIAIPLLTIDDQATNMIQGIASAVIGEVVMVEALPQISEEREVEEASIAIEEISEEEEEEEATVVLEDMTTEDPLEAMTTEGLQEEDILMEGGSGVFMCYDYVVASKLLALRIGNTI